MYKCVFNSQFTQLARGGVVRQLGSQCRHFPDGGFVVLPWPPAGCSSQTPLPTPTGLSAIPLVYHAPEIHRGGLLPDSAGDGCHAAHRGLVPGLAVF